MLKFKNAIAFLLATILISFCFSCAKSSYTVISTTAFNSDVYIAVNGNIDSSVKELVLDKLSYLDRTLSVTKQNSCVYNFNASQANQNIAITEEAFYLLQKANELNLLTNGKFNVAVRPLSKLWQLAENFDKTASSFTIPSLDAVNQTKLLCNTAHVSAFNEPYTARKAIDGVEIDFGGIAKGYATDCAYDILKEHGATEGYISIGGSSIRVFSTKENLLIKHPRKSGEYILSVSAELIKDKALSTSGDSEKFYVKDGVRYSHIIDASTGKPINTNVSLATVIGANATVDDALSTALCSFNFNPNEDSSELITFIKTLLQTPNYTELSIFVVYDDSSNKTILTNKKQGVDFALLDDEYSIYYVNP